MAPGLFTTARLPSRTPPAPSGITSSSLGGPQRRSLSCRAHAPAGRAALIEVSPAASAAQLHYVSTDEEDGAHVATRVVAAASSPPSSPTVLEASAAATTDAAASQQQSHSAPCSPKAAPAAAAAPAPAVPVPAPVVMAAAAVAAAAAHATTAAATITTTTTITSSSSSEQAQQEACSTLPVSVPVPIPSTSSSAATACTPAPSPTPSHNASDPACCSASVSSVAAVTQELPSSCATTYAYAATDADARSDARLSVAACSSVPFGSRDHNSVTIKANTNVKDAAGAVVKVLGRLPNVLVTALRLEPAHEALNRAVKSIAVARKYLTDEHPESELSFLPVNRSNAAGLVDPNLFAFLCFRTHLAKGLQLLEQDKTDLNVSRGSNANAMANAIIRILKERGQAVMKAGGSEAIFIAMSAVVNARTRLKRSHGMDAMVVPAWITEDTTGTLGRESKFLRLNILPCAVNGPFDMSPALA